MKGEGDGHGGCAGRPGSDGGSAFTSVCSRCHVLILLEPSVLEDAHPGCWAPTPHTSGPFCLAFPCRLFLLLRHREKCPFFIKPPLSDSLFSILGLLTFQDGTWGHFIHLGATKGSVNLCSRKVGPFSGGTHFMVVLFAGKHWGPSEDPMRTRLRGTPWCLYVHVH